MKIRKKAVLMVLLLALIGVVTACRDSTDEMAATPTPSPTAKQEQKEPETTGGRDLPYISSSRNYADDPSMVSAVEVAFIQAAGARRILFPENDLDWSIAIMSTDMYMATCMATVDGKEMRISMIATITENNHRVEPHIIAIGDTNVYDDGTLT